jgi:hypothetical protein
MSKGFCEGLWKNLQAIKLGKDGGIEAPARADGENGIVIGVDAVANATQGERHQATRAPGWMRTRLRRLFLRP